MGILPATPPHWWRHILPRQMLDEEEWASAGTDRLLCAGLHVPTRASPRVEAEAHVLKPLTNQGAMRMIRRRYVLVDGL